MTNANDKKSCVMMIASLLIVGTIGAFRRWIPLSSALLAFCRGIIGAASLLAFTALTGRWRWQRVPARKLVGMIVNGAFLGINWMLLFEAFNHTSIARATLAYYMQPTILLLLSPILFHERLTLRKLACAALALAGMVLVSGVVESGRATVSDLRGILYGLGAACFYALVIILNKKVEGVDAYQKTVIQLAASAAALLPYLLANRAFSGVVLDVRTAALVLVVGVVHTGITYALYFGSMTGLRAQTISALSYIDPVAAMLVSALVLREGLSPLGLIGAVLIIGSAIAGERAPSKARR